MPDNNPQPATEIPNTSESFGNVRKDSASFGKVPNASESFGRIPHGSETFGKLPKGSERKENHSMTVREVARMFETAGVARTERSITNWCQENRSGIARLDAYFDPNERRYFITPQSAELAIQEEKARMAKVGQSSETHGTVPKDTEEPETMESSKSDVDSHLVKQLEQEVLDLKITNKGKDYFIEQLQKERDGFAQERQDYVEKLITANHKVGELETRLLQLASPKEKDTQTP
jgi:hypothetical protein